VFLENTKSGFFYQTQALVFPTFKAPSLLCREGAGGESREFFVTLPDPAPRVDPLF